MYTACLILRIFEFCLQNVFVFCEILRINEGNCRQQISRLLFVINPYPTAFPYGNGMVLHFYQQQESSTTKTVHKVINKWLKAYV